MVFGLFSLPMYDKSPRHVNKENDLKKPNREGNKEHTDRDRKKSKKNVDPPCNWARRPVMMFIEPFCRR
jgi:hypothetical protein